MMDEVPQSIHAVDAAWVGRLLGDDSVTAVHKERIGEGFGLAAESYRVDITAARPTPSLVVKLCDGVTATAEGHVYEKVLPRTRVPHPEFVAAVADGDRGVVVYRFIEATQGDLLQGGTDSLVAAVVDALAALHGSWWGEAAEAGVPSAGEWMRRELTDDQVESCLARHGDVLGADAIELLRSIPSRVGNVVDELFEHPLTVVHADAHLDNVLILGDGTPVLLDWSSARIGPAAIDVARCLVEGMTPDQRRRLRTEMVRRHHRALCVHGIDDYPVAELERAVHLATLAFLPGLVRWGAGGDRRQLPARATSLLRSGLRAATDAALGR
jgi:aminoglycoside phosphotransferase (APT) family kinase protein